MTTRIPSKPAGSYGVDAILVPVLLSLSTLPLLLGTIANIAQSAPAWTWLLMGAGALSLGYSALAFWYTTLRGKFLVWARLLDSLHLRGDENSLDLGCGRGAVIIATALRLSHVTPRGSTCGATRTRRAIRPRRPARTPSSTA